MPGRAYRLCRLLLVLSLFSSALAGCVWEWPPFDGAAKSDPTATPSPTIEADITSEVAKAIEANAAEWLVMLYFDADDPLLERDMLMDLNEAERAGSTQQVHIVAQVDRYAGAFEGMGGWHSTKRFYLTADDDLHSINSRELADLGETNMADGTTLSDFVVWAVDNYPARKHALILSDHGSGWPGGFSDPDPGGPGAHDLYLTDFLGDNLWLMELDQALETALTHAGLQKLEVIGLDACLMSQLEVYSALAPYGRYAVASEELEPGLGWAYTGFLRELTAAPAMGGAQLARLIVGSYIDADEHVLDDSARQEFLNTHKLAGDMGPGQLARQLAYDATLAAVDLGAIPELGLALDNLTAHLVQFNPRLVAEARAYAQAFDNIFDSGVPSPYIDLGHLALWLREAAQEESSPVGPAADQLLIALERVIIAERHGPGRPGAMGIAIHFPTQELYEIGDNLGYTTLAARFAGEHQWDDFLHIYYTGQPWSMGELSGEREPLRIGVLTLSSEIARPGEPVHIQAEVTGNRLGFLYSFIGRVIPDEEVLLVQDIDYLLSDETQVIGGVAYPVWSPNGIYIDFKWEPIVYAISDGTTEVAALLAPDTYGEVPTYATEGTYVFARGGTRVNAKLFFRHGELTKVYGYMGSEDWGAPHQITPQNGDRFIVWEQGIRLGDAGERARFRREGATLTFGKQAWRMEAVPARSGAYVVGFMAEDLDGKLYAEFETLAVESGYNSMEGLTPEIDTREIQSAIKSFAVSGNLEDGRLVDETAAFGSRP